ncbi:MAG: glutaredoxin family protein [Gammaproteobacteria bacterium]|nr:glutaredoxin family protein [Gammaproteobacteria bacterium]MDH5629711.1 glutaredoxin family protein [Gammaproteobacteria bacterium]
MSDKRIQLYTTLGCHLCEQVEEMFQYLQANDPELNVFQFDLVEIGEDETLMNLYGVRIPVLEMNGTELAWPFEIEKLYQWLKEGL